MLCSGELKKKKGNENALNLDGISPIAEELIKVV